MGTYAVVGQQGAGKTLYVVRKVLKTVEGPRPAAKIYGNLNIDHPNFVRESWDELLDPDHPPGIKILDEAARAWDSRRSMSHTLTMLQASTEERKHGRDVWMTAQLIGQLDNRIRAMLTRTIRLTPLAVTKRKYDRATDEIVRREHPRLIMVEHWKGAHGQKMRPEDRAQRGFMRWGRLAKYTGRYDTTESIQVAGHLAAGKDFYRDSKGAGDSGHSERGGGERGRAAARPGPGRERPGQPEPVRAGSERVRPGADGPELPGRPTPRSVQARRRLEQAARGADGDGPVPTGRTG